MCQHQHGDEDEYDGRYGKIDRLGREADSAGVVSHGPPSPVSVHFPSSHYPKCSSDGRIAAGKHRASWQKARHLAGPEFANSNDLLALFVRLFVSGLRTARILTLLLRTARILGLLLWVGRIGRLRGFVGALLRI